MRYPAASAAADMVRMLTAVLSRNETVPPANRAAPASRKMRLNDKVAPLVV
jgi:hypothetical protein